VGTKSGKFIAYISENAINDFVYLKDPNSPFKTCSFAAHGCTARADNLHHPQHASRDWIRNNAGFSGLQGRFLHSTLNKRCATVAERRTVRVQLHCSRRVRWLLKITVKFVQPLWHSRVPVLVVTAKLAAPSRRCISSKTAVQIPKLGRSAQYVRDDNGSRVCRDVAEAATVSTHDCCS
jgi:hypothetical protein